MAEQTQAPPVDAEVVAKDLAIQLEGALEQDQIDAAVEAVKASVSATGYAAHGSVASMVFYLQFQVTIDSTGKTFNGKAGGISTPGGGALFGTVYTDDMNRLIANTKSFAFQVTAVYTSIEFFDGSSNVLGTFQAGSISTVAGTGGGSGSWS